MSTPDVLNLDALPRAVRETVEAINAWCWPLRLDRPSPRSTRGWMRSLKRPARNRRLKRRMRARARG